jgi:hypothetical protein
VRRPPLVDRATGAGPGGTSDGLGELLHILAAGRGVGRAASTAGDVAAVAWIASALPPGAPFFVASTAELEARFTDDPDVHVLGTDWAQALPAEAPFDLVHVAGPARNAVDGVLAIAAPRATLIVPLTEPADAPTVAVWLAHPRLDATTVSVAGVFVVVAVVRG